jgi:hypothetical protein
MLSVLRVSFQCTLRPARTNIADLLGSAKPESLYKFLQRILYEQEVEFIVAPYSAAAQVSLARVPSPFL